jgi:hypothetical protein
MFMRFPVRGLDDDLHTSKILRSVSERLRQLNDRVRVSATVARCGTSQFLIRALLDPVCLRMLDSTVIRNSQRVPRVQKGLSTVLGKEDDANLAPRLFRVPRNERFYQARIGADGRDEADN